MTSSKRLHDEVQLCSWRRIAAMLLASSTFLDDEPHPPSRRPPICMCICWCVQSQSNLNLAICEMLQSMRRPPPSPPAAGRSSPVSFSRTLGGGAFAASALIAERRRRNVLVDAFLKKLPLCEPHVDF